MIVKGKKMKDKISIDLAKEWERVLEYNDIIIRGEKTMGDRMDSLIQNIQDRINAYKDGLINDIQFIGAVTEMTDNYIESKIDDMEDQIDDLKGMISYDR